MKTRVLFLALFLCSLSFGQSAKKLNKQLLAELALEEQKQDSAYAFFRQSKREYDSVKSVMTEKYIKASGEEQVVKRLWKDFSEMYNQLNQLGVNPNSIMTHITQKNDGIPECRRVLEPVEELFKENITFDKVSKPYFQKDLKTKEWNVLLSKAVEEYRYYSRVNSIRQEKTETNTRQLKAFFPTMDSLSRVYQLLSNELRSNGGKLRDKLDELRGNYMEKGPKGFPEAYEKVFYDVFPPLQSETKEDALKYNHSELAETYGTIGLKPVEPEIYTVVDEPASFPGGTGCLLRFIFENLHYPQSAMEMGIQGKAYLRFIVSDKGEISNITFLRKTPDCPECDEEAMRLVKSMPKWIPAKNDGKPVNSYFHLPITFKLN